ncbi:hypothetical protein DL93DRAFT_2097219 [Clavulina sp. PMI_390]|nr:hypothetical protein DL93DRAFT_2097219 [Clavulina sp. PMI_390]
MWDGTDFVGPLAFLGLPWLTWAGRVDLLLACGLQLQWVMDNGVPKTVTLTDRGRTVSRSGAGFYGGRRPRREGRSSIPGFFADWTLNIKVFYQELFSRPMRSKIHDFGLDGSNGGGGRWKGREGIVIEFYEPAEDVFVTLTNGPRRETMFGEYVPALRLIGSRDSPS